MRTHLRGLEKFRLFQLLNSMEQAQVWKRSAADLAEVATERLGFTVTPAIVGYARRIAVPKPPAAPGLDERLEQIREDLVAVREALATHNTMFDALEIRLTDAEKVAAGAAAAVHHHEAA